MTDDNTQEPQDRDNLVDERRKALAGNPKGKGSKVLFGIIGGVVFVAIAALVLAPDQVRSLFGGASTSETMQETSTMDGGISTEMTVPESVDTTMVDVDTPMRPEPSAPAADDSEYRSQIAELERKLQEMQDQSGSQVEQIRSLLEEQKEAMRDQFERERKAEKERHERELQAARDAANARDEDEAAARARLEEERAKREAIAHEQVVSDALVLDAGGKAAGASSSTVKGGDRKLSSNEQFMAAASTQSYDTVRATLIANPGRTIVQGSSLEAVLETAVSTELPGIIRAVVSHDVYSYDGENVLLPRGSRLIGSYNSDVSIAQNRAQIAWNRAVTPKGVSVEIGGYGADQLGMSGQAGKVDTRFRERFGTAALISLITLGPQFFIKEGTDDNTQDAAEDLTDDLENSTQSVMGEYLALPPVIYIGQGTKISVIVNRDLVF